MNALMLLIASSAIAGTSELDTVVLLPAVRDAVWTNVHVAVADPPEPDADPPEPDADPPEPDADPPDPDFQSDGWTATLDRHYEAALDTLINIGFTDVAVGVERVDLVDGLGVRHTLEIGGPFVGDPFVGDPFVGDPFIGDPFIGDPFVPTGGGSFAVVAVLRDGTELTATLDIVARGGTLGREGLAAVAVRSQYGGAVEISVPATADGAATLSIAVGLESADGPLPIR